MRTRCVLALAAGLASIAVLTADAAAMYHPTVGRWLSRDPLGYADSLSLSEYVLSSPLMLRDPDGTTTGGRIDEYRQLTWDDFQDGKIEGGWAARVRWHFDFSVGELEEVEPCYVVSPEHCRGIPKWTFHNADGKRIDIPFDPKTDTCYTCAVRVREAARFIASVDPSKSVKDPDRLQGMTEAEKEYTRKHEQGHFRAIEAVAREFNLLFPKQGTRVWDYGCGKRQAWDRAWERIMSVILRLRNKGNARAEAVNDEYERDTDHGRNSSRQEEWNKLEQDPSFPQAPPDVKARMEQEELRGGL